MFKLKYTQKLGLIISITTSLVILFSFATFLTLFYYISINQIRNALIEESNEVITTYITLENNELKINSNEDLERDALRDRLSMSIYTKDLALVNSFGLFSDKTPQSLFNNEEIFFDKLKNSIETKQSSFNSLSQREDSDSFEMIITPLVNEGNVIGVIVIISPIESINKILESSKILIAIVLPLSLISLYFLGQQLGRTAFKPVKVLIQNIKKISHDNLGLKIPSNGHEEDETTILTEEFNNMLGRLEESFLKQKRFISNSSHELRTPLTRLQTGLGIISGNESLRKDLSDEIEEMANTLSRLSLLSKLEHTNKDAKSINLFEFLNELKRNRTDFERVINAVQPDFNINIEETDLNILLENLILNALKYSKEIVLVGSKENYIFVKDFGIGIPADEISQLLTPFYRAKNAKSNDIHGNGLGLSIVKEICDIYSLKPEILSEENAWTEIRVYNTKIIPVL